jgi:hypothetical protein
MKQQLVAFSTQSMITPERKPKSPKLAHKEAEKSPSLLKRRRAKSNEHAGHD